MTTNWLTPETAITQANLNITPQDLLSLVESGEGTPEERFQARGLLFDPKRHDNGEPYLALISPLSNGNDTVSNPCEDNNATVTLSITFIPNPSPDKERTLLVTAGIQDACPIVRLMSESELGELPDSLNKMLGDLKKGLKRQSLNDLLRLKQN